MLRYKLKTSKRYKNINKSGIILAFSYEDYQESALTVVITVAFSLKHGEEC